MCLTVRFKLIHSLMSFVRAAPDSHFICKVNFGECSLYLLRQLGSCVHSISIRLLKEIELKTEKETNLASP